MTSRYSRLHPSLGTDSSQVHLTQHQNDVPLESMAGQNSEGWAPPVSSDGSTNDYFGKTGLTQVHSRPTGNAQRMNSGLSLPSVASSPWEHKLNEKHIREVPTDTETVRYFDPRRQTRRVFFECLFMWFWTAGICGALAGTMYGFSTLALGLGQYQKYGYNALITGLSIMLGLAFAAQFKQYAEMMRWRFLASQYRTLQDFEDVLGCDSYRSTLRILWTARRRGSCLPTKSQCLAAFWLLVFVAFNVCAALLGLTYSIDVSENFVHLSPGNLSVTQLQYISSQFQPDNGLDYPAESQKGAANLWGQIGQSIPNVTATLDDLSSAGLSAHNDADDLWWYHFVDLSPSDGKTGARSVRAVTSQAHCVEYKLLAGGYAGTATDDEDAQFVVQWEDNNGNPQYESITNVATYATTWMGNSSSSCGPRCTQVLALQSTNFTDKTTSPHLWACNNTVSQVINFEGDGFDDPDALKLPDAQAQYLAGAIGWTGVDTIGDDLQFVLLNGDSVFATMDPVVTADYVAQLVMGYTIGTLAAMDKYGAPRVNLTGSLSPSPAQVVNVKWIPAGGILAGIPTIQFIMLLGVVWFASKAIILEPSYVTAAHLLYPVIKKVGKDGCLFTVDECAERLGHDYKLTFGVRPDPADPGHQDTTFVRDLDVIEETEGYGYIRGKMPEGRYD